jgi:hypothetical protein
VRKIVKTPSGGFNFLFVHERFGLSCFGGRAATDMKKAARHEAGAALFTS